ncbi:hypothetical protein CDL15_Pgr026839 [Punica granatum]|uniref:PHD-type domain-containing protein n=1 Tax=Punica granatum TaxID=22663 RepID=A0A218WLR1_PUNGR|nr:hypothetical protein CDL15_Pgr026839 [Punica granatum]
MANGTDSEEFVVLSNVRPGLKRELAFALKAQSEICGDSLGRTRSRRAQGDGLTSPVSSGLCNKRLKKSSDGPGEDNGDSEKLGLGAGKVLEGENVATGDLEDVEGEKSVGGAVDLMSEEEAKSDVVDLEDEPDRAHEDLSSEKAAMDADVGGFETGHSGEERPCEAVTIVFSGNDGVVEKESHLRKNPVIADEDNKESVLSEKPSRRFTRSVLKAKVEEVEKSASKRKGRSASSKTAGNGDDNKLGNVVSPSGAIATKLEMKMSKKIGLRHPFVALKDFLETGLLEGFHVKYTRSSRGLLQGRTGLQGVIKGSGILCSCDKCKGVQVVSPTIFELHAGSSNKRPPEYIFLENGRTLRDVMNAVKDSPLETVEEAVQAVLGTSSINKCTICINCKGPITEVEGGKTTLLCKICLELRESYASAWEVADTTDLSKEFACTIDHTKRSDATDQSTRALDTADQSTRALDTADQSTEVPDNTDQSTKVQDIEWSPEAYLVRKSSASTSKYSSSRIKSHGRDLRLHKLVFEEDVLPDGTEVSYYAQGKKMLVGYKRGYGIYCTCCKSEVSASQFEAHAGFASRRKPYLNIYTSNGVSLHELSVTLAKTRRLSITDNDDLCSICSDGGELLCCDTCPRAFHLGCIHLSRLPTGGWNCKHCENMFQKEKFVESNANALAAGRIAGADAIQQITNRCIRIVKTPETDSGGCALCRGHGFARSGFGPRTVIICDQCEKEFHVGCLRDHKIANLKELPEGKWFCCSDCERIHSALESYVVRGDEKLPDSLLDVIRMKLEEKGSMSLSNLDIRWRVLNAEMDSSAESKRLLAKSVSIFHERFDPITESTNGQDLITAMVNGREVVSAGLLRVFGGEVAELPLVATSSDCQGLGYFQSLFACMERLLASFHVKKLVLPAAEEAESIWTKKFGFDKVTPEELMELRKKHHNMMIFQGTSVLQKSIPGPTVDSGSQRKAE